MTAIIIIKILISVESENHALEVSKDIEYMIKDYKSLHTLKSIRSEVGIVKEPID